MIKSKNVEKKQSNERWSAEAKNNLTGFFDLLLKIDRRINHQNYIKIRKTNQPISRPHHQENKNCVV